MRGKTGILVGSGLAIVMIVVGILLLHPSASVTTPEQVAKVEPSTAHPPAGDAVAMPSDVSAGDGGAARPSRAGQETRRFVPQTPRPALPAKRPQQPNGGGI